MLILTMLNIYIYIYNNIVVNNNYEKKYYTRNLLQITLFR